MIIVAEEACSCKILATPNIFPTTCQLQTSHERAREDREFSTTSVQVNYSYFEVDHAMQLTKCCHTKCEITDVQHPRSLSIMRVLVRHYVAGV